MVRSEKVAEREGSKKKKLEEEGRRKKKGSRYVIN